MAKIINLKTKGDISSLVTKEFNGIVTKFLIPDMPRTKKDKLLRILSVITETLSEYEIVYNGKIDYGYRNKRIEIAIFKEPFLFIGCLSDYKKLDSAALEIDKVIGEEKSKGVYENINIIGCIFLEDSVEEKIIESVRGIVANRFIFINLKDNNWVADICRFS